ncbi:MAG: MoxR family ATPase [Bdellovibrionota bacterium]
MNVPEAVTKIASSEESELDSMQALLQLREEVSNFLSSKPDIVDVTLCAIVSSGHLLLEDVPGVGKTTFIKALARMVDLNVSRIQFTSDLLPSDVIGTEVFDTVDNNFKFHKGPIFSNLILADELNRASPRTQSALLEAMGEGRVSVDRSSYLLPRPFIVFASQNPMDNVGTYEIPESQLDRFSAKISLGYPQEKHELNIFKSAASEPLNKIPSSILSSDQLIEIQKKMDLIHISDETAMYAKKIIDATRHADGIRLGISTRGGVMWLRMAKARAILSERNYVIPDDLKQLAIHCLSHRILTKNGLTAKNAIREIIDNVNII